MDTHKTSKQAFLQAIGAPIAENIPWKKEEYANDWSIVYRKKALRILPWLRFLPGVRGVFLCNSVAFGTAQQSSDIDLLIITAPKKLWTARIFATTFLQLLGVRRHGEKIAGRFCLSFFITENALNFSRIALPHSDPYLGFWTLTLFPIFGEEVFQKIRTENRTFVQHETEEQIPQRTVSTGTSVFRNGLEFFFGNWVERAFKKLFLPRALRKEKRLLDASGIIISETILKFHNQDRRREIRKKYHWFLKN